MKQTYHSNSTTNLRLRREINKSTLPNHVLAEHYGVSQSTVVKWKSRTEFQDRSSRPKSIKYSLSELEMLIATELRAITWWVA